MSDRTELIKKADIDNEIWLPVVGAEKYYLVSNYGKVKSIFYKNGLILANSLHKQGYITVEIKMNGKRLHTFCHVLAAKAFIPNPQNKKTVNHKDGIKSNNYISNLEWTTQKENNIHAWKTGLNYVTEKMIENSTKGFKINKSQVKEIRERFKLGLTQKLLSAEYNVSIPQICRIVNNKSRVK